MQSERELRIVAYGLIVVVGALAYANTFDGRFVWDDASSVLLHRHVQLMEDGSNEPLSSPAKFFQLFCEDQHAFGLGQGNFYRPLVAASFTLDFFLSYEQTAADEHQKEAYADIGPLYFHLSNLGWHLAAALLLFLLLLRAGAPWAAGLGAALLFVAHPLHTEAVAYISGRADMMSAAFMFAGLYFVVVWLENRTSYRLLAYMLGCLCAALLSKESSTAFPLLAGVFVLLCPSKAETDGIRPQPTWWRGIPFVLSMAVLAVYATLRMTVLRFAEAQENAASPLAVRLIEVGQAFASYIRLLFVPTGLHMERTLEGVPAWTAVPGYALLISIVLLSIVAYRAAHWRIAAGFTWFLITWLPISGIFPLNAPLAEHWMYVPMAGFWWSGAEIVYLAARRVPAIRYAACAATAALVVLFLGLTALRNQDWHDNASIYRATLAKSPGSQRVHANLATTYKTETGNLAGARRHFSETIRLLELQRSRPGVGAPFLNETYFHTSLAALTFWDITHFEALARTVRCLDAIDAFGAIPMPPGMQAEDVPLRTVVAPMGQAYTLLLLGEFDRAENAFREGFLGTGAPDNSMVSGGAGAKEQAQAQRAKAIAATASFQRAEGIFSAVMPRDLSLQRLVGALAPDTLLWPHRPEPFWKKLFGAAPPGPPAKS